MSKAFFTPAEEHHQRALGEHIIGVFRESGAYIVAEDLGTVPDFLRESLERLQVPGYRVLRWEREWHQPGQPFRDPAHYPARSLATTGTHDTDPLAIAWDDAPPDERAAIAAPGRPATGAHAVARSRFDNDVRDAVLKLLYASGSDLARHSRSRTSSAGAIASTRPPPSATPTGRGACPGRSIA